MIVLHAHLARQTSAIIAAADWHFHALIKRDGGTDSDLCEFCGRFTNGQVKLVANKANNILIELVTGDFERSRYHRSSH